MRATYCRYDLIFKEPATTSRETMTTKETYFIRLSEDSDPSVYGIGECALFRGLSADDTPDYEKRLHRFCESINAGKPDDISDTSSMLFGYESALCDLQTGGRRLPFPSIWTDGGSEIEINGLVWMGSIDEMHARVEQKLAQGFRCVKFKIGGQNFDDEYLLLKTLRDAWSPQELEIRLDANGAFSPDIALSRLERLSALDVNSIEQPIKAHQWDEMAEICRRSPIPIALDEELIDIHAGDIETRRKMLEQIKPRYIILKPSLCGGITGARQWIDVATSMDIDWWVTSALESNIGLNTLAQWVATLDVDKPQGLGTGNLYINNIQSPLVQQGSTLCYDKQKDWQIPQLAWVNL